MSKPPGKKVAVMSIGAVDVPVHIADETKLTDFVGGSRVSGGYVSVPPTILLSLELTATMARLVLVHELFHAGKALLPQAKLTEENAADVAAHVVAQNWDEIEKVVGKFGEG